MDRLRLILPIEKIEERYSAQWWTWTLAALAGHPEWGARIIGNPEPQRIHLGQFLDVYGTCLYKSDQLFQTIRVLEETQPRPATVVLYDAWYPGLEALAYIRDTTGRDLRIVGVLHAGTYDPYDFLAQQKLTYWARNLEKSWGKLLDKILVATEFHRSLLVENRGIDVRKIRLVKFPVFEDKDRRATTKGRIVVFPHRLAPEKQPEVFEAVQNYYFNTYGDNGTAFVMTKRKCSSKEEYYNLLARSKVSFSSALQETFGIAMQESINLGCVPIVPDRLAYRDTIPPEYRYRSGSIQLAARMIHDALEGRLPPPPIEYRADITPLLEEAFQDDTL